MMKMVRKTKNNPVIVSASCWQLHYLYAISPESLCFSEIFVFYASYKAGNERFLSSSHLRNQHTNSGNCFLWNWKTVKCIVNILPRNLTEEIWEKIKKKRKKKGFRCLKIPYMHWKSSTNVHHEWWWHKLQCKHPFGFLQDLSKMFYF